MFGGKKIMLGVLNDVPQVDLATDFAKALCKALDLKEGKSVLNFDKNVRRET